MEVQAEAVDEKISESSSSRKKASRRKSIWRPYLFPILMALAVILGSLISSIWILVSENKALEDAVASETAHLTAELPSNSTTRCIRYSSLDGDGIQPLLRR